MTDPILKLLNVESAYGPIKAIRGVSLQVEPGRIATVLGSNGAKQEHHPEDHLGHHRPGQGYGAFQGRGHHCLAIRR